MDNIPLEVIKTNVNDGAANSCNERVTAVNGDGVTNGGHNATERDVLLSRVQINGGNGETMPSDHAAEGQRIVGSELTSQESGALCRIRNELQENVYRGIKLWMVIIFIFVVIVAVILISLAVCSAIYEDTDENFDPSLFKVPHYFNGSFQMPNQVFTEELSHLSSNESQALAADLQNKLADLYRSSPALGRYFSGAEIYAFRNGSVVADYKLKFVLPEEEHDQLRNFTLSREVVYNVLRQFLYDQELSESEPLYIDPVSLKMFGTH